MAVVYVGVGSNSSPETQVQRAIAELKQQFSQLEISPIYRCPAVGYPANVNADDYFNLVVKFNTELSPEELVKQLKKMEVVLGRRPDAQPFTPKVIDLDLLLFDDFVQDGTIPLPHPDILTCGYILLPLAQLAPEAVHPVARLHYVALWREFQDHGQNILLERIVENQ